MWIERGRLLYQIASREQEGPLWRTSALPKDLDCHSPTRNPEKKTTQDKRLAVTVTSFQSGNKNVLSGKRCHSNKATLKLQGFPLQMDAEIKCPLVWASSLNICISGEKPFF